MARAQAQEKRAQIKMVESILVMIIFFFLLVFGLIFYTKYSGLSGNKKQSENLDLVVMENVQRVQYMSELQCTKDGREVIADCFDVLKLKAFRDLAENNSRYAKLYPNLMIEVTQIYPPSTEFNKTIMYNNMPNITNKGGGVETSSIHITLYDPVTDKYAFGLATVGVYYLR
ncbi:hypothetical protein JXB31_01295 [Candidatus Woesearchaeota archaeon]|nr:hypothetical protein [Candidatus Woesearchaeota archaeon]